MKKKATKKEKRYRVLHTNGMWWNDAGYGWKRGIKNASRMTKELAQELVGYGYHCAIVEVGTKPSTRQLFKSGFVQALEKLASTYGLKVLPTTHDTFYIGGWD